MHFSHLHNALNNALCTFHIYTMHCERFTFTQCTVSVSHLHNAQYFWRAQVSTSSPDLHICAQIAQFMLQVDSISVSVFVFIIFVELDKYWNWNWQIQKLRRAGLSNPGWKGPFSSVFKTLLCICSVAGYRLEGRLFLRCWNLSCNNCLCKFIQFFFDRRQQHLKTSLLVQLVVQTSTTTALMVQLRTRVANTKKGQGRPTTNNHLARWGT